MKIRKISLLSGKRNGALRINIIRSKAVEATRKRKRTRCPELKPPFKLAAIPTNPEDQMSIVVNPSINAFLLIDVRSLKFLLSSV